MAFKRYAQFVICAQTTTVGLNDGAGLSADNKTVKVEINDALPHSKRGGRS